MTDSGATVGPRLKAERERRGLSSQKAADELHLDGWIIEALEAEDYPRIGPSVYAKGHLKRYAALLGLPGEEIMAGYESRAQAPPPPASQPANVRLRTDAPAVSGLPWAYIAGSAVLGLLILGLFRWQPWHSRAAAPAAGEALAASPGAAAAGNTIGAAEAVAAAAAAGHGVVCGAGPCGAGRRAAGHPDDGPSGRYDGRGGACKPAIELFRGLVGGCA